MFEKPHLHGVVSHSHTHVTEACTCRLSPARRRWAPAALSTGGRGAAGGLPRGLLRAVLCGRRLRPRPKAEETVEAKAQAAVRARTDAEAKAGLR